MSLRVVPLVEHASESISFKEQHIILSFFSRENHQGLQNQRILHSVINMLEKQRPGNSETLICIVYLFTSYYCLGGVPYMSVANLT